MSPAARAKKLLEAASRRKKTILKNASRAAKCARSWRKRSASFHRICGRYACCVMFYSIPPTKLPGGCGFRRWPCVSGFSVRTGDSGKNSASRCSLRCSGNRAQRPRCAQPVAATNARVNREFHCGRLRSAPAEIERRGSGWSLPLCVLSNRTIQA